MTNATQDVVIELEKAGRSFQGDVLIDRMHELMEFRKVHGKLNRKIGNSKLLDELMTSLGKLIAAEPNWQDFLKSRENLEKIGSTLADAGFETEISYDEEHSLFGMQVRNGSGGPLTLNYESLSAAEWRQLLSLYHRIAEFRMQPIKVKDGDKETVLENEVALIDYIVNSGKKNLTIQRYKGLGEMNPTQLWETTMDPDTRTLLQVNIDDAIETDEIFTILMGDQVEPRRKFIEDNALNVKNLDV